MQQNVGSNGDSYITMIHPESKELFVAVMDGAVSPYFYKINGEATDAFASRQMKNIMQEKAKQYHFLPSAQSIVAASIDDYAKLCNKIRPTIETELRNNRYLSQHERLTAKVWNPACAFVTAVFHVDGSISIAQATDCTVSSIDKSGRINVLTPDTHEKLSKLGKLHGLPERPETSIKNGKDPKDVLAREFKINQLNRENCYNQPDGIGVFNGEYELMTSGCLNTIIISPEEAACLDKLVLVSDGMTPGRNEIGKAISYIVQHGAAHYYSYRLAPHFNGRNPIPTDATSIVVDL